MIKVCVPFATRKLQHEIMATNLLHSIWELLDPSNNSAKPYQFKDTNGSLSVCSNDLADGCRLHASSNSQA